VGKISCSSSTSRGGFEDLGATGRIRGIRVLGVGN